jgi:acetyl-CoA carboxylase biotin carboxylase subunit
MHTFNKILIANRGEIAVRIIRSARELDIKTVAVYSRADRHSLHVKMADEAYEIGIQELSETYLNIEKIIAVAKKSGAEAIHPGYGFLAENPALVAACDREGIVFIGPSVKAISLMGNKIEARRLVRDLGIPMTEGATGTVDEIVEKAATIPLPLLVKAAAGGGGKGMRIVRDRDNLRETIEATSREAKAYFGDGEVYVEQYIEEPRHIEIQVIGDKHGNVVHLYERECSIQRRYQKIIEESPSPTLNDEVREKMGKSAADIAAGIGYDSAGTIEFLVDKSLNFYFLEMNTRIQVEHPVTEMVTGIDIVREQILVAAGNPLSISQKNIRQTGHAIEARIYAEDPASDFMPSPGDMTLYVEPKGRNIRVDAGIDEASTVQSFYDPMISKLIVWGNDRETARVKLINALNGYIIHGIRTNIEYLRQLIKHEAFINNNISTKFCDENTPAIIESIENEKAGTGLHELIAAFLIHDFNIRKDMTQPNNIWNKIGFWRFLPVIEVVAEDGEFSVEAGKTDGIHYSFKIDGKDVDGELRGISSEKLKAVIDNRSAEYYFSKDKDGNHYITSEGLTFNIRRSDEITMPDVYVSQDAKAGGDAILAPMPGKIIKVNVKEGDSVKKGDVLVVVEAMKMENSLEAHRDAVIETVNVVENEMVDNAKVLIKLKKEDD